MRKIYILPNLVTSANMFCGFYSIIATMKSQFVIASWAIVVAGVFDLLDGRIARLAKATSSFGVEYDSMSDLISFGAAPAILLYQWGLEPFQRLGWLAAFIFMVCGALRLARFNVTTSTLSKAYFQGLPIPAAAGLVVSFVIFNDEILWLGQNGTPWAALAFALVLGSLMVSNIAFPSFKEFHWRSKATPGILLIGVMVMILMAVRPEIMMFVVGMGYLTLSLLWQVWLLLRPAKTQTKIKESTNGNS